MTATEVRCTFCCGSASLLYFYAASESQSKSTTWRFSVQLGQSIVSNCATHVNMGESMQKGKLLDKLRLKGWTIKDAALYLGVSRQRLYSVSSNPSHDKLWDCAVDGIPTCSDTLKRDLRQVSVNRSRKAKNTAPKSILRSYSFDVGDLVVCDKYAGIADFGDEGAIAGLREANTTVEILVSMPGGEDWFSLNQFNEFFLTTGR